MSKSKYYKVPESLLASGLSPRAILLYSVLADRQELSAKNETFKDKTGTYILYRIEAICSLLGVGERTAKYLLAELEDAGLLIRRKQGHGRPQKIYVQEMQKLALQKKVEVQKTAPLEVQKTAPLEVQKTAPLNNNTDSNYPYNHLSSGNRLKLLIDLIEKTASEMNIRLSEYKLEKLIKRIRKHGSEIGSLKAYLRTAIRNADLIPEPKEGYKAAFDIEEYESTSVIDEEDL